MSFLRNGQPVNAHRIRSAHEWICKKAGIENFTFHDFRHIYINNWRKEGRDYFKIMAASGHKTISVFKRYNMVDERELKTLVQPWSKNGQISQNTSETPSTLIKNFSVISSARGRT
ncbi:MAG TPA: tyrosine-type recombinase/integrase [Thermodesulfobacteriota bacterium]|nr:tyrosine-type recombinase/integrase [Thermodesulfobacteriota bacterium]